MSLFSYNCSTTKLLFEDNVSDNHALWC